MTKLTIGPVLLVTSCLVSACASSGDNTTDQGSGAMVGAAGNTALGGTASPSGGAQPATGGEPTTGGTLSGTGGAALGGQQSGGATAGGAATGGATSGGVTSGGATAGGTESGGATAGGTESGGATAGGAESGGSGTGGAETGGGGAVTCPDGGWTAGKQTITTQWDGQAREYVVYIPQSYTGTTAVPLLMVIHGAHNTPGLAESWSQMDPIADENGFIIIYPAGLDCWNVGGTVLPGCSAADDDVGFLNNVIAEVESQSCIDTERVYVTGISNGSMMAQYMGCHFTDTFAAAGGVAAAGGCTPSRPLPFFYVLGTADDIVGWDNGANALNWAKRNNCNTTTPVTVYDQDTNTCIVYQDCDAGVEVEFCTVTGMPHCWPDNCYQGPGGYQPFKVSPLMWDFFSKYTLP